MFNNKQVAKAVRLALISSAAVGGFTSQAAFAADEAVTEAAERIQVTGSRIKRTDMEGANPVTVIDRAAIDMTGESSVADLLRNTTFNSGGSFRPRSGSSAQGVSEIDMRGIGAERTLVLVDGRRLPKSPSTGSSQDLNSIPLAAVERVEILSNGASAVYGSDAIGGVINVITRKDFNGAEIKLGAQDVDVEGGDRREGSVVFGSSNDTTNILGGVSWNSRDIVFYRDYDWYEAGASAYGNSFTTFDADGNDNFNFTSLPGACDSGPGFYEVNNPNAVAGGKRCAYDFNLEAAEEASTSNQSLFLNARHELNDDWAVYSNMSATKTESFGRYAPVPARGVMSADSPNNPTNPDSVMHDPAFGENQEVTWWHRFDSLGNRDSYVNNEATDLLVGASGDINDISVDFGFRETTSKTYDIGYNYLVRNTAEQYINDGTYNLQKPTTNSETTLNAMKATISRISKFDQKEAFASAAFDTIELPAGMVQAVVGAEYREEIFSDQYDSLSEAGQIGGSAGNSSGGDRDATAIYAETMIPVLDNLELSVAGRYDDYSDYGSDFSPQVSVRWEPMDDMVIRGSWGKGFRAPSLDILTQKETFAARSVSDPQSCINQGNPANCEIQVDEYTIANPNLESEQSDQLALGLAYQPTDWFNFAVDYYNIKIDNRIAQFTAADIVRRQQAGDPVPSGLTVTRSATGSIVRVEGGYANEGDLETSGFDFNGIFTFDFDSYGTLKSQTQVSYVLDYAVDGLRDNVGDQDRPEMRATISNVYNISDFDIAWNINYIDGVHTIVDGEHDQYIPSWTTHDIQATYNTPWNSKVTVGLQNAFGKDPHLVGWDGRDYNMDLYNGYGRVTYVRFTQSF